MLRVWGRVGQVNGVGGTWTLVQTTPSGDNSNVYLVRRDGSGLRPLTSQTTGDATKAVFSPTGMPVPSRELFTNTELRR